MSKIRVILGILFFIVIFIKLQSPINAATYSDIGEGGVKTYESETVQNHYGWIEENGFSYYIDEVTGEKVTGKNYIDGYTYYFNSLGERLEGRQVVYGEDFYLGNDGKAMTRIIPVANGMQYAEEGRIIKDSFKKINGYVYYFGSNGEAYNNGLNKINSDLYYFSSNGVMTTGWININDYTYYFDETGKAVIGKQIINGDTYYFNSLGELLMGQQTVYGEDYHLGNDGKADTRKVAVSEGMVYTVNGKILKSAFQVIDNYTYYFGEDGLVYNQGLSTIAANKYYFKENGTMLTGWLRTLGHTYYMDVDYGYAYTGKKTISNDVYYFNSLGERLEGRQIVYGEDFHLGTDGKASTRIVPVAEGMVYTINGKILENDFKDINGYTYYFGVDGVALNNGLNMIGDSYYYFKNNGTMATGWMQILEHVYYFDLNRGEAKIGKQFIDGDIYYFNSLGYRLEGKIIVYGDDFHLGSDGKASTRLIIDSTGTYYTNNGLVLKLAFQDYAGNTYYFGENGLALKGIHIINGKDYYFDDKGILTGKWIEDGEYTYYIKKDGGYATDWLYMGENKYFFNSLGHMIGTGPVKRVIDVSENQGIIDWDTVKSKGAIDRVILRCGYGSDDSQEDKLFARNVAELRRLNIPFSIYLYSYSSIGQDGIDEANFVKRLINKYALPSDIEIYYDIENNGYNNGLADYEEIIPNFIDTLHQSGYRKVFVYSYTSYLNTVLNSPLIYPYVNWVAQYNYYCSFTGTPYSGWQYSSTENVAGINGNVDMNVWFN